MTLNTQIERELCRTKTSNVCSQNKDIGKNSIADGVVFVHVFPVFKQIHIVCVCDSDFEREGRGEIAGNDYMYL